MHMTQNMPEIVFLHGNVAVGHCIEHKVKGFLNGTLCPICKRGLDKSNLLYPVAQKNYQIDAFIEQEWDVIRSYIERAYLVTIFGYSAPYTDVEARDLMNQAWNINISREFSAFHIVDIMGKRELKRRWRDFNSWSFSTSKTLRSTYLFNHPRRSCDAFAMATMQQSPWKDNPFPRFKSLERLQKWLSPLIEEENRGTMLSSHGIL